MRRTTRLLAVLGFIAPCAMAQTSGPVSPDAGLTAPPPAEPSGDLSSGGANATQSEAGLDQRPPPSLASRLKPETQGDVTYLCGGVGEEEIAYMKQEAKKYDLMLTFAARNGAYLADVDVDIADARGNPVLQANCDSPIMLVDLPKAGSYRVHADASGYTLDRRVKVAAGKKTGKHLASAVMVWPQQVAESGLPSNTSSGAGGGEEGDAADGAR